MECGLKAAVEWRVGKVWKINLLFGSLLGRF